MLLIIYSYNPLATHTNLKEKSQLPIASSTYTETLDSLKIITLKGGLGVSAVIKNTGTIHIYDVGWSIEFGDAVKIGNYSSGTISEIWAGYESKIRSGFVFGIGSGSVTVAVGDFSIVQNYIMIGPFVFLKKGPGNQIKNHDMIIYYTDDVPRTLDPADAYDAHSIDIISQIYDTLVTFRGNDTKMFYPCLATDWKVSNDSLTWIFNLRHNVKFSNGDDFTAEDVEYSFDRVLIMGAPESGVDWILAQCMDTNSTTVINDFTVQITLTHPYGGFLALIAHTVAAIVDKDYVETHGGIVPGAENVWMKKHPIGTGPYMLDNLTDSMDVFLTKNLRYWGGWDGNHINKVVFETSFNLERRISLLKNGDADITFIPYDNLNEVINEEGIIVQAFKCYEVTLLAINTKASNNIYLADGRVRNALSYAFDYDSAIGTAYNGYLSRLPGAIPIGMPYDETQNSGSPYYDYDLGRATQILNDAGYIRDHDVGGTLYRFNGTTIQLFYNVGSFEGETMATMFHAALNDIGILSSVIAETWPQLLHRMYTTDDWDMMFIGWGPDYNDPDDYIAPLIGSADIGMDTYNTGYGNGTVDEKILEAKYSADAVVRSAAYEDAYDIYIQEPSFIFIGQQMFIRPMRDWIMNYSYNPAPGLNWNFYDCYKGGLPFNRNTRNFLLLTLFQQ
jgi:peptide/nickel transport system substrate-binding protein